MRLAFNTARGGVGTGETRDVCILLSHAALALKKNQGDMAVFHLLCIRQAYLFCWPLPTILSMGLISSRRRSFIICTGGTSDTTSRRLFMQNTSHRLPQA